jgi:aldehyde dehydrogenase (NAD+)
MELSFNWLCPLVSAVAAGNQVVLKPSELTGNTAIISKIITKRSM